LALVRDAGVRGTLALLLLVQNRPWDDAVGPPPLDSRWHTHSQAASLAVRSLANTRTRVLVLSDGSALVEDIARARLIPVPFTVRPQAAPPTDADVLAAADLWVDTLGGRTIGWSEGRLSPQTMECAPDGLWLDPTHIGHALPKGRPTPFFQAVQGLALVLGKVHQGPPLAHLSLDMGIPAARGGWYKAPRLSVGFFVHNTKGALHTDHATALKLFVAECVAHFGPQALCGWRWGREHPLPEAKPLKVPVKAWEGHPYHDLNLLEHVPSSAHGEAACLGTFLQAAPRSCAVLRWDPP
jgi:hypothetical protein